MPPISPNDRGGRRIIGPGGAFYPRITPVLSGGTLVFPAVSGLQQRFESDISTLTYSSGTSISQCDDISGNARHWTQATGSAQPTRDDSTLLNGKSGIRFTAASLQYFDAPNFLTGFAAAEVFVVLQAGADPGAAVGNSGLWKYGSSAQDSHYPFTDGIVYEAFGTNTRKATVNPTPSLAVPRLYNVMTKANGYTTRLDGTQLFTTATNTVGWSTTPQFGHSVNVVYFNGWVWAFALFNAELSTQDRDAVEAYYAAKYAMTIA